MILTILLILLIAIHLLRWLAIVQQKEYRWDRFYLFLRSREGIRDFFLPMPILKRLPRKSDIKRPRWTLKMVLVFGCYVLFLGLGFLGLYEKMGISLNLFLALVYLKVPITIMLAVLPVNFVAWIVKQREVKKAQEKFEKCKPVIIGITGSYGKSSTKFLIKQILESKFRVFVTPKSYNTIYSAAKVINDFYQGEEMVILEYGAYKKNEIKNLAAIFKPEIAVITGITDQHLGLFGSLENIIKAKSELIKALPEDGVVFYNGSDERVLKMVEEISLKKVDYSKVDLKNEKMNERGEISFKYVNLEIKTNLVGKHYLTNVKAGISLAHYLGMNEEAMEKSLGKIKRNEMFIGGWEMPSGLLVIDDGRSCNPKGFYSAIQLIEAIDRDDKILLASGIVDLGEKSGEIHRSLAQECKKVFKKVFYLGVSGKKEFKEIYGNDLIDDKMEIIREVKKLGKESLLLIEGKMEEEIMSKINPKF